LERDDVPEPFEVREASRLLVGVEAGEVVAAGIAVDLAGVSMCQQATMIECLTAAIARFCPRRARSRQWSSPASWTPWSCQSGGGPKARRTQPQQLSVYR
jgi:hypothetical protein